MLYITNYLVGQYLAMPCNLSYASRMAIVPGPAPSHVVPAGNRAWTRCYDVFRSGKSHMASIAAEFDMTPQQAYAMRQLGEVEPGMSEFAAMLGCDASNVTSIVDRFESRGFVERRASSSDRRVKVLVLTAAGKALHATLVERLSTPPPAIANLSVADQKALYTILERALATLDA